MYLERNTNIDATYRSVEQRIISRHIWTFKKGPFMPTLQETVLFQRWPVYHRRKPMDDLFYYLIPLVIHRNICVKYANFQLLIANQSCTTFHWFWLVKAAIAMLLWNQSNELCILIYSRRYFGFEIPSNESQMYYINH